jgi:hypothetical protein
MLKLYILGICILLIAIIANILAGVLGLMSWYDALLSLQKNGAAAFRQWRFIDYIWLFFLYPMLLGGAAFIGNRLYELLLK